MQHPVRVEGVPHVLALAEGEAHGGTSRADPRLGLAHLLGRAPVLAHEVGDRLDALGAHVRVELEGLEVEPRVQFVLQAREGLLEGREADRAPGAGDVGDEGDVEFRAFHERKGWLKAAIIA